MNYPRLMYALTRQANGTTWTLPESNGTITWQTVYSAEEEAALGADWSRTRPPAPEPAPPTPASEASLEARVATLEAAVERLLGKKKKP